MSDFDVFISHASEDKRQVVLPLVDALRARGVRVWFDDESLAWGDSLSAAIGAGLVKARFGIVVISRSFLSKAWPQHELKGLWSREIGGEKVILPLWHGVTKKQVVQFDPSLADKKALDTTHHTFDEIAGELCRVLGKPVAAAGRDTGRRLDEWPRVMRTLYREDFDLEVRGDADTPWIVGRHRCWHGSVNDGVYELTNTEDPADIQYGTLWLRDRDMHDVPVSVKVRLSEAEPSGRAGLLYRFDADKHYFAFVADREGRVRLFERFEGGFKEAFSFDRPSSYRDGFNKLGILGDGAELLLFVNDELLARVRVRESRGTACGLIAVGMGTFQYDDFGLYEP